MQVHILRARLMLAKMVSVSGTVLASGKLVGPSTHASCRSSDNTSDTKSVANLDKAACECDNVWIIFDTHPTITSRISDIANRNDDKRNFFPDINVTTEAWESEIRFPRVRQ